MAIVMCHCVHLREKCLDRARFSCERSCSHTSQPVLQLASLMHVRQVGYVWYTALSIYYYLVLVVSNTRSGLGDTLTFNGFTIYNNGTQS